MAEETQIVGWDEALSSTNFVKFKKDENGEYYEKTLTITNWELVKGEKFGEKDVVEFRADVVQEDGQPVTEKKFTTVSNRLKTKLKAVLSARAPVEKVTLTILPIGEDFSRQYSVKEVKGE